MEMDYKTLLRSLATQTQNASSSSSSSSNGAKFWSFEAALALGLSALTATSVTLMEKQRVPHYAQPDAMVPDSPLTIPEKPRINQPPPRPDLPIYTREEVSEHTDVDSLWYTFRGGVYDLTFFYNGHPGGSPVSYVVWMCLTVFL